MSSEHIYQRLGADLRRFIQRRVQNEQNAEDLTQETLLKIHQGLPKLQDHERLAPWVFRIARNVLIDHARRGHHADHASGSMDDSNGAVASLHEKTPRFDGHQTNAIDSVDNHNDMVGRWLQEQIAELDEPYRQALMLTELEGISQTDLAQRLGLSASGARTRVQRGRAQLKSILGRSCQVAMDRRGNVVECKPKGPCCS